MNIYAANGTKVTVTEDSIEAGYPGDSLEAKKYLRVGNIYTVEKTIVGGFHTTVYIKEVPLVSFNSVNFEDIEQEEKLILENYLNNIKYDEYIDRGVANGVVIFEVQTHENTGYRFETRVGNFIATAVQEKLDRLIGKDC